jgi:RES domain-containing protein
MPEAGPVTLWRAFVPRWAHLPLSGEGAARFGGRWNPVGVPAIYAARELSTAWAEYNQGFVQHPALIAQFQLDDAQLVDLTDPNELAARGIDAGIHDCEWRDAIDKGKFDGLVYPSFMSPGGTCVTLWRWNAPGGPRLTIIDPDHRLPRTQASWL